MSTLGKVLILLNLLVGAIYAYLLVQDQALRQTWVTRHLEYRIALDGLPVEKAPSEFEPSDEAVAFFYRSGRTIDIKEIPQEFLNAVFKGAQGGDLLGGNPVASQVAEVERVQGRVDAALSGRPEAEQIKLLRRFLLDQTRDGVTRDRWRKMLSGPEPDIAAARTELTKLFTDVLNPNPQSDPKAVGEGADRPDREKAIGHLLVGLSDGGRDRAWLRRVVVVVGASVFSEVVAEKAGDLGDMENRVKQLTQGDTQAFLPNYNLLIRQAEELAAFQTDLSAQERDLRARRAELAELGRSRRNLRDELGGTGDSEGKLQRAQKSLDDALAKLQALQADIARKQTLIRDEQDRHDSLLSQINQALGLTAGR